MTITISRDMLVIIGIALAAVLLIIIAVVCKDDWDAVACEAGPGGENVHEGRVMTHTFTGRRFCDNYPYADSIADMGRNDWWIDE